MGKKGKKAQAGKPKKLTPKDVGKRLDVLVKKLGEELKGADLCLLRCRRRPRTAPSASSRFPFYSATNFIRLVAAISFVRRAALKRKNP